MGALRRSRTGRVNPRQQLRIARLRGLLPRGRGLRALRWGSWGCGEAGFASMKPGSRWVPRMWPTGNAKGNRQRNRSASEVSHRAGKPAAPAATTTDSPPSRAASARDAGSARSGGDCGVCEAGFASTKPASRCVAVEASRTPVPRLRNCRSARLPVVVAAGLPARRGASEALRGRGARRGPQIGSRRSARARRRWRRWRVSATYARYGARRSSGMMPFSRSASASCRRSSWSATCSA